MRTIKWNLPALRLAMSCSDLTYNEVLSYQLFNLNDWGRRVQYSSDKCNTNLGGHYYTLLQSWVLLITDKYQASVLYIKPIRILVMDWHSHEYDCEGRSYMYVNSPFRYSSLFAGNDAQQISFIVCRMSIYRTAIVCAPNGYSGEFAQLRSDPKTWMPPPPISTRAWW